MIVNQVLATDLFSTENTLKHSRESHTKWHVHCFQLSLWRGSQRCRLAESFSPCSQRRMSFIILDPNGQPLRDIDDTLILVATEAEAREFLRPDDKGVANWDAWSKADGFDHSR